MLSNYSIKRILPRLIIAVILVNTSFFVCQLIVDVTQILGASLVEFLKNVATGSQPPNWTDITVDILAGSGIVVGLAAGAVVSAVILALSISGPMLTAALLAIVLTVIILIGRQAAIVILTVVSPLAFVAYLLPNTEGLFKKWMKMFGMLLMVYPIISLLYGGGALAARIIHNAGGGNDFWMSVTALGVSSIPLIMTPKLLKGALDATGSLGAKLSGATGKLSGMAVSEGKKKFDSGYGGDMMRHYKKRRAEKTAKRRAKLAWLDRSPVGRALGLDAGSYRAQEELEEHQYKDAERVLQYEYNGNSKAALKDKNAMVRAAAAHDLANNRGSMGIDILEEHLRSGGVIDSRKMAATLASVKPKHAGIASAGVKAFEKLQDKEHKGPVSFTKAEMDTMTDSAVRGLSPQMLTGQTAGAINNSKLPAWQADTVLNDPRLANAMSGSTAQAMVEKSSYSSVEDWKKNRPQTTNQPPDSSGQPSSDDWDEPSPSHGPPPDDEGPSPGLDPEITGPKQ